MPWITGISPRILREIRSKHQKPRVVIKKERKKITAKIKEQGKPIVSTALGKYAAGVAVESKTLLIEVVDISVNGWAMCNKKGYCTNCLPTDCPYRF